MAWAVVQVCWLKEQVSQVEDEAPLRSDACHSYLKSEIGYLRFDVFSHKTLFSGGNENHACVLCEKRTSPR